MVARRRGGLKVGFQRCSNYGKLNDLDLQK